MRFVLHRRPARRRRDRNWIAKGKTHALIATAIATGAPSVGAPALGQIHVLTAGAIASGAPSAGAPAINQVHALTATAIASGAPSTGSPAIAQAHALVAMDIAAGAPNAGAPALGGTAPPILIEGDDFDLPRADRKRVYELRLRADLEAAGRALREARTRAAIGWDAPQIAPPWDDEGPREPEFRAPWLPTPSPADAQALDAARDEEDDEDVLLLAL